MLFRKPVKGDVIQSLISYNVATIQRDWSDRDFGTYNREYRFVEVTPIEPPKSVYINVIDTNQSHIAMVCDTVEHAKRMSLGNGVKLVARVKIQLGQFDD